MSSLDELFKRNPFNLTTTFDLGLHDRVVKHRKERALAKRLSCPLGMEGDRLREILAPAKSLEEASEILKRLGVDELVDPADIEFGKLTPEIAAELANAAERERLKAEKAAAKAAAKEAKAAAKAAKLKLDPRQIDLEDLINEL